MINLINNYYCVRALNKRCFTRTAFDNNRTAPHLIVPLMDAVRWRRMLENIFIARNNLCGGAYGNIFAFFLISNYIRKYSQNGTILSQKRRLRVKMNSQTLCERNPFKVNTFCCLLHLSGTMRTTTFFSHLTACNMFVNL